MSAAIGLPKPTLGEPLVCACCGGPATALRPDFGGVHEECLRWIKIEVCQTAANWPGNYDPATGERWKKVKDPDTGKNRSPGWARERKSMIQRRKVAEDLMDGLRELEGLPSRAIREEIDSLRERRKEWFHAYRDRRFSKRAS